MCDHEPVYAKGKCWPCYDRDYKASRTPRCHPDRPHASGGKCWACYRGNQWVEDAKEDRAAGISVERIAKSYGKTRQAVERWVR